MLSRNAATAKQDTENQLGIVRTKPIGDEISKRHIFHPDKATRWSLPLRKKIDNSADSCSGRGLDGSPMVTADGLGTDPFGVDALREATVEDA